MLKINIFHPKRYIQEQGRILFTFYYSQILKIKFLKIEIWAKNKHVAYITKNWINIPATEDNLAKKNVISKNRKLQYS